MYRIGSYYLNNDQVTPLYFDEIEDYVGNNKLLVEYLRHGHLNHVISLYDNNTDSQDLYIGSNLILSDELREFMVFLSKWEEIHTGDSSIDSVTIEFIFSCNTIDIYVNTVIYTWNLDTGKLYRNKSEINEMFLPLTPHIIKFIKYMNEFEVPYETIKILPLYTSQLSYKHFGEEKDNCFLGFRQVFNGKYRIGILL